MHPSGLNPAHETPRPTAGRFSFDWKNPDYDPIWNKRAERLKLLRSDKELMAGAFEFYSKRENYWRFIRDWGVTFDPRRAELGQPSSMPFLLFDKQREWIDWVLERWENRENGLTEKSRDCGVSWLTVALASTICTFENGIVFGMGSRDQDTLDKTGDPSSLFWKAKFFMNNLPREFRQGWNEKADAMFMRISFPATGSTITGDAGDNIGRGGRASIYVVDEAAYLKHPKMVDASLSATTNCRIDVSSVNGMASPFAQKRHSGRVPVFTFHWRHDPRKDDAWYEAQKNTLDPITLAQEIDINYSAAAEGVLIPSEWIQAAIDLDQFLKLDITGDRFVSLDVADEGRDLNAAAARYGIRLEDVDEWSGKGSDIFETVVKVFHVCEEFGANQFRYDADGLGAGVRGDARAINNDRRAARKSQIVAYPFRGSGKVLAPTKPVPNADPDRMVTNLKLARKNEDYFMNAKAQEWWNLRLRFQRAFRVRQAGSLGKYKLDDLIVLNGKIAKLVKLIQELQQVTYSITTSGKILVDKQPDGMPSPNLADSVMIVYSSSGHGGYTLEDLRKAVS